MKQIITIILCLYLTLVQGRKSCLEDKDQAEQLSDLYRTCALSAETELESERLADVDWLRPTKDGLCNLLQVVIRRCTPIFEECFDERDFRDFQDSQIEMFLQAANQIYRVDSIAENCTIAQKYFRRRSKQAEGKCSSEKNNDALQHYHKCTNHINGEVQGEVAKHAENPSRQQHIFCNGVFKAVYGCALLLQECYSEEEVIRTITTQKELLRRLLKEGTEKHRDLSLDSCSVFGGPIGSEIYEALKSRAQTVEQQEQLLSSAPMRISSVMVLALSSICMLFINRER